MFPGLTTKCSQSVIAASTQIDANADILSVNDTTTTTAIATINPHFQGASQAGVMFIVNRSGASISFTTAGNIVATRTIPDKFAIAMIWDKAAGAWYPGAIS